jgi:hypothetical protein
MPSITLAGRVFRVARPGLEPRGFEVRQSHSQGVGSLVQQLRKLHAYPAHHGPCCSSVPTWIRTRTKTLGESCAVRYTIGTFFQEPTTGFAPASTGLQDRRLSQSSHVGIKHEREESNPVRQFWRLAALPGAHSCNGKGSRRLEPGAGPPGASYFASSTFQYASLTNFDQLSIRSS